MCIKVILESKRIIVHLSIPYLQHACTAISDRHEIMSVIIFPFTHLRTGGSCVVQLLTFKSLMVNLTLLCRLFPIQAHLEVEKGSLGIAISAAVEDTPPPPHPHSYQCGQASRAVEVLVSRGWGRWRQRFLPDLGT